MRLSENEKNVLSYYLMETDYSLPEPLESYLDSDEAAHLDSLYQVWILMEKRHKYIKDTRAMSPVQQAKDEYQRLRTNLKHKYSRQVHNLIDPII